MNQLRWEDSLGFYFGPSSSHVGGHRVPWTVLSVRMFPFQAGMGS